MTSARDTNEPVRRVRVETRAPYDVLVGPGALDAARGASDAHDGRALLVDRDVLELHRAALEPLLARPHLALEGGEDAKTLARLGEVLDFLVTTGLDRTGTLIVVGGGSVGDLGGLAASLYLRGIDWISVPTTLLAQVDASIGGKTAINLAAGKNLAGTFHQPRLVAAEPAFLGTLPAAELRSGLGEVLKTAILGDPVLFERLEEDAERVLACDRETLAEVVERCARVKGGVVARDERESGERAKLNLGHTFGHAIEHAAGFGTVPHGEAVGVGIALALEAASRLGLAESDSPGPTGRTGLAGRTRALLERLGLPSTLAAVRQRTGLALPAEDLLAALRHDKKRRAGRIGFVLPRALGDVATGQSVPDSLLAELFA